MCFDRFEVGAVDIQDNYYGECDECGVGLSEKSEARQGLCHGCQYKLERIEEDDIDD